MISSNFTPKEQNNIYWSDKRKNENSIFFEIKLFCVECEYHKGFEVDNEVGQKRANTNYNLGQNILEHDRNLQILQFQPPSPQSQS